MRIAQITPGVIPIPPNGWGAVEKVIWEYTKILRSLGHEVEILYTDDVKPGEWDIVHVHMANLALILRDKGIPYVFSHHDHHAYHFGKNSEVYRQNIEAIKGSVLTFVHAKYLVNFFEALPQIRYLGHGANIHDYVFEDRSKSILEQEPKLIMMAHNGILGDPLFDRKGFIPGIDAAKLLNLPITVVCPSKINQDFFRHHSEVSSYEKLTILYDLDYIKSLEILNEHHIFLNPGILEAGHPNLTVAESISLGIPVVGTMESDIPGQMRIDFNGQAIDSEELAIGIQKVINSYSNFVLSCQEQRNLFSWEVVVSRMIMEYVAFSGLPQKKILLDDYKNTNIKPIRSSNPGYYYWFRSNPYFYKCSAPESNSLSIVFKDSKTGSVINYLCPGENKRNWVMTQDDPKKFIDWEIVLMDGAEILNSFKMDLRNQHVLIIKGSVDCPSTIIEQFIKKTDCIATLENGLNVGVKHFREFSKNRDMYYRILNTDQIVDYFVEKKEIQRNPLLISLTKTLGDTISMVPYANEFAKKSGIKCDLVCDFGFLFGDIYENINIIPSHGNLSSYTDIIACNYKFDLPLQIGFAKQFKIGTDSALRPSIVKSGKQRPLEKKYVCFSMHSTAQAKHWNYKDGWVKLCEMLKQSDLIPVCIDRYDSFGIEGNWNPIPYNCLNKTGMDLMGMINWMEHCEFFIGLSSGLSWVAHAVGKKVVMISGVTLYDNEFTEDCIRIHKDNVCNSCFNFPEKYPFDKGDWMWCPLHRGTPRHFECTKKISAKQVIERIIDAGWINRSKKLYK
jgi:autotransporter strand-loop-strand O-heptosyltransferase